MDWTQIAAVVTKIVSTITPLLDTVAPEAAPALAVAEKIIHGVIVAEPVAVDLYNRMRLGNVPTPEELQKFAADYESAYQKLKADIAAKLTALGTP